MPIVGVLEEDQAAVRRKAAFSGEVERVSEVIEQVHGLVYPLEAVTHLIEMRMDSLSPLQRQRITIEMSNSSGIRVKDAAKIESMLKAMKIEGNASIVQEAENEARRVLEYEIDF